MVRLPDQRETPMSDPTKKPMSYADYRKIANRGATAYRASHKGQLAPGLQAQHWNKVKESAAAQLDPKQMNSNMSLLQSHGDKPATTLLTSPNKQGTTYSVGDKTYVAEHSFADNHLFPAEHERTLQSSPGVDKAKAVLAAGASTSWKMRGETGPVDPSVARTIDISKGEKLQAAVRAEPASSATRSPVKPASAATTAALPKGPKVTGSPAGSQVAKPATGPAVPGPGASKVAAPPGASAPFPSAPKIAPPATPQGSPSGATPGSMSSLMKTGGMGKL
jgi:hypothetical protein